MGKKEAKRKAKQARKAAKRAWKAERRKHRRKAQAVLSRAEIADQLRALAAQIEEGIFVLGDKEVELPSHADYKLIYTPKKQGGHRIKAKIAWDESTTASLLPTE